MNNQSKKKIAILYSGGRYFGGIEQYLIDLFNNIDKNEFELELLSLGNWPLIEKLKNNKQKVTVFSSRRINPRSIKLIGQYLCQNNFDLLVSQGTVSNAYGRAVSLVYKIPNLVTVHSNQSGDYANPLTKATYCLIEKLTRFPTHQYIAVSNYLKKQMVKMGLPSNKIIVIYNGLDFPEPDPKFHKGLVIGSVGRLHPVKGYDSLIRAFADLQDENTNLRIAGDGEELERLKNLTKELGVADRVEFVGFKKDIFKFLNTIDIYIQSSIYEGFGLAVAEAMSQQLPVIVTPAGSMKEIVENGRTGIVCGDFQSESLKKALLQLINNPKLAEQLGKNAKKFVAKNFEIKRWTKNTEQAYKNAIK